MMPMFGTNSANRQQPAVRHAWRARRARSTATFYNLNWVDWNNDRHQDGWLDLHEPRRRCRGADLPRPDRIADVIDRFGVDAYFLDIVGGHVNNPKATCTTGHGGW